MEQLQSVRPEASSAESIVQAIVEWCFVYDFAVLLSSTILKTFPSVAHLKSLPTSAHYQRSCLTVACPGVLEVTLGDIVRYM